jgi:hypothetical protein
MAYTQSSQKRDLRLDFFRGISLFIILIDHMRGNVWGFWTPGQFGFSDAACIFIFISGYTSALAFGNQYQRTSWLAASARVMQRVWQLYVAQIAVVFVVAALPGVALHLLGNDHYSSVLQLDYLFKNPTEAIWHLATLTYVPGYLDILPVYIAMMAMIPLVILIARVRPSLVLILACALWVAARTFNWNLPADPSAPRGWFFDPFTWQFMFFTGFSLGMGWVTAPRFSRPLMALALGFIGFSAMLRIAPLYDTIPFMKPLHDWAMAQMNKTVLDPLEYVHFMALAYIASHALRGRLQGLEHRLARIFVTCGQNSLPVFLGTVVLADLGAMGLDVLGSGAASQALVNVVCLTTLGGVGLLVAWFKGAPWKTASDRPGLPPYYDAPRSMPPAARYPAR